MAATTPERQREKVYRHRPLRHTALDRLRWHLGAPFFRILRYILASCLAIAALFAIWFSLLVPSLDKHDLDQARTEFSREADAAYDRLDSLHDSGTDVSREKRELHTHISHALTAQTREDITQATEAVRTLGVE